MQHLLRPGPGHWLCCILSAAAIAVQTQLTFSGVSILSRSQLQRSLSGMCMNCSQDKQDSAMHGSTRRHGMAGGSVQEARLSYSTGPAEDMACSGHWQVLRSVLLQLRGAVNTAWGSFLKLLAWCCQNKHQLSAAGCLHALSPAASRASVPTSTPGSCTPSTTHRIAQCFLQFLIRQVAPCSQAWQLMVQSS